MQKQFSEIIHAWGEHYKIGHLVGGDLIFDASFDVLKCVHHNMNSF